MEVTDGAGGIGGREKSPGCVGHPSAGPRHPPPLPSSLPPHLPASLREVPSLRRLLQPGHAPTTCSMARAVKHPVDDATARRSASRDSNSMSLEGAPYPLTRRIHEKRIEYLRLLFFGNSLMLSLDKTENIKSCLLKQDPDQSGT